VRAYQVVPYVNGGQWKQFTAVRTNVSGLGETTVPVLALEMVRARPSTAPLHISGLQDVACRRLSKQAFSYQHGVVP
jgi:hypothetical protein